MLKLNQNQPSTKCSTVQGPQLNPSLQTSKLTVNNHFTQNKGKITRKMGNPSKSKPIIPNIIMSIKMKLDNHFLIKNEKTLQAQSRTKPKA
jgi:hypothetical protein